MVGSGPTSSGELSVFDPSKEDGGLFLRGRVS